MLFVGFSPVVNADEVETPNYHVYVTAKVRPTSSQATAVLTLGTLYPWKNTQTSIGKEYALSGITYNNQIYSNEMTLTYAPDNAEVPLIDKTGYYKITLSNIRTAVFIGSMAYLVPSKAQVIVYLTDGTVCYPRAEISTKSFPVDLQFELEFDKPIKQLSVVLNYTFDDTETDGLYKPVAQVNDSLDYAISYEKQSKVESYLYTAIAWIKDVSNGVWQGFQAMGEKLTETVNSIKDGFSEMGNWLKSAVAWIKQVATNITELPAKLWKLIEDGLKSLFIPSEAQLATMYAQMEENMADKLGVLWQAITIFDSFGDMMNTSVTGTVTIPQVSIPVGSGEEFSFGPYDVKVVPDAFMQYTEICKTIVNVVITLLFINVIRKRLMDFLA